MYKFTTFLLIFLCVFSSCRRPKYHLLKENVGYIHHKNEEKRSFDNAISDESEDGNANYTDSLAVKFPTIPHQLPSQIISRKSYTVSYNKHTHCANWVAWTLTANHADGPFKRKQLNIEGNYIEDEDFIKDHQNLSDWNNVNGYDHGHMCPSGDNKWNLEAMRQTFYLSNMCVQNSRLNQEAWEHLESTSRIWAKKYGEIYIVCGPIFISEPIKKIGVNHNLSIPDAFFKVILCIQGKPKAIGFIYNNCEPETSSINKYAVSIDEIEQMTEFDFFPELDDELENTIEAKFNLKDW